MPDIVPLTQTVTRGKKRNRNECDTTVRNKKHRTGCPSPSTILERKDNKKTVAEKKLVTKINYELKLRSKKSKVSDQSTPTSIHFTRSQRTGMQRNDDEVPHETVKQKKKRSNSNDFGSKPIPEKKKKKQVDAIEIVESHTKKKVWKKMKMKHKRAEYSHQRNLTSNSMQHEVKGMWNALMKNQFQLWENPTKSERI